MHPFADRPGARRIAAAILSAAVLAIAVATGVAAVQPRVDNPHGKFKDPCAQCHTADTWKIAKVKPSFDHSKYGFPLAGAHAAAGCLGCHTTLEFSQSKTQCASCHTDPHRGELGADCARCHSDRSFLDRGPMVRAHQLTRFPLTGGHAALDCESCHRPAAQGQMQFVGTRAECFGCHEPDYRSTKVPDHVAGSYPHACLTCHSTTSWSGATFNHDATGFRLVDTHRTTACVQCHSNGTYAGTPRDCASCHSTAYNAATPNHPAAGFAASACASCHRPTRWSDVTFDHNATSFPLTGKHVAAACNSCHADNVYDGKPTACMSCHMTEYNGASPNHATAGWAASACASCHTTQKWDGATFDHNTTAFPLTGAHVGRACNDCHADNVYDGKSTACISCHQGDYNNASPPHNSTNFPPAQCTTCHNTRTWGDGQFNHATTAYPLTGQHVTATCTGCHTNGTYAGTSQACMSCHMSEYNAATPNHVTQGFAASTCASCHTTQQWAGGTFDHATTSFALTGAHRATPCNDCHGDGVYDGKPTACVSCHSSDYSAATPIHNNTNFPTAQCASCHTTSVWTGGTFNHAATAFPLTGKHVPAACVSCHPSGVYAGTAKTCDGCHMSEYNAATPNHLSSGFAASACAGCHNTNQWDGAVFDHNTSSFPLTGAHVTTPCASCHGDGVYNGKPITCISCHTSDYNTAVPVHVNQWFPTATCTSCHNTTAWSGARITHDAPYFPIYSGKHNGRWDACSDCHNAGSNYAAYTCLSCHPHSDKAKTDGDHSGRRDYQYVSSACYSCHPRGSS